MITPRFCKNIKLDFYIVKLCFLIEMADRVARDQNKTSSLYLLEVLLMLKVVYPRSVPSTSQYVGKVLATQAGSRIVTPAFRKPINAKLIAMR